MKLVIDMGSNSVKYLLATEDETGSLQVISKNSWVTRLGKRIDSTRELTPESIEATRKALTQIRDEVLARNKRPLEATQIRAVATSAVRDSKNPEAVSSLVESLLGAKLHVITGQNEARLIMAGAAAATTKMLGNGSSPVFIEVGGASTQVGHFSPHFDSHSFQAGAVRCHEALGLAEMPVSDALWARSQVEIQNFFPLDTWNLLTQDWKLSSQTQIVAIGGSLVIAAKMGGGWPEGNLGFVSSLEQMEALNEKLRRLNVEERMQLGIEDGRGDIICAGILCLTTLMKRMGTTKLAVTRWGLRHGILHFYWDDSVFKTSE